MFAIIIGPLAVYIGFFLSIYADPNIITKLKKTVISLRFLLIKKSTVFVYQKNPGQELEKMSIVFLKVFLEKWETQDSFV